MYTQYTNEINRIESDILFLNANNVLILRNSIFPHTKRIDFVSINIQKKIHINAGHLH